MRKKTFPQKLHKDSVLVKKAKEDKENFEVIYQKYFEKVHRYVRRRMQGNPDVAEDVTQETFVRAFGKLPQFQMREYSYLSYLLRIAHNLLVSYYRRKKPVLLNENGKNLTDEKEDVERSVSQKIGNTEVNKAIAQLSVRERNLLILRYERQLSIREMAKELTKSENAVKVALSRTKKHLAKKLRRTRNL
jgi:RNA polymerase sigma-70 factor (ECF subfamily)